MSSKNSDELSPYGMDQNENDGLPSYQLMSKKEYFRVNFAKFVIELFGTFTLTIFYLMMGDQEAGMFLGLWVLIIFGMPISGSHFNPLITFGQMMRGDDSAIEKQLGVIYIAGQLVGGILGGLVGIFMTESADVKNDAFSANITPIQLDRYTKQYDEDNNGKKIFTRTKFTSVDSMDFGAMVSEGAGAFVLVLMTMMIMQKSQQFTKDKNLVAFTKAAIIVCSRFIGGSMMVTGLPSGSEKITQTKNDQNRTPYTLTQISYKRVGPLLNPAIAFGLQVTAFDFNYVFQYLAMPVAGEYF